MNDCRERLMSYESVHEMFSRTAAEFGSQIAIQRGGRCITYAELEAESNRLANFLRNGGAVKGTIVGLLSDDPIAIITGILGVLKAGAVFVPLDPTFPTGRLLTMSDQVEPQWFVSEGKHLEKLSQLRSVRGGSARVLCLDDSVTGEYPGLEVMKTFSEYRNTTAPGVPSDPDAPCSIYFTSGSTGRPKAILGRLQGIDHFMRWEIEAVGAGRGTRVSQLASPAFDGFLKDTFLPLCSGGVVCAPESRDVILDAWSLADWLDFGKVEVLHCVPSLFRSLLNEKLNNRYFEAMKCVVLTVEPLYPADVKRWLDVFGDRLRLFNIYGTTETSLSKFAYENKPEEVDRTSIPVGKPIKGAAMMVIDQFGQPCGVGDVGEIYIRTPYRSFGYHGEPALTKQVFVPNPFSDDPTDIVHKTGDYGRLLKSGDLEHLGRRDQQVQIRGVRVELGEIENLLRSHEGVADVAVIDRDDAEGNKFLVVYVTTKNGTGIELLRQYFGEHLPPTMLPSAFIELDQLPRTLNGKIDRKALPSLESIQAEREIGNANPRGPVEEIVAGIWSEVLKIPVVRRDDDFFNLGGHSLLVTHAILRVRETLKVELPIRSLFEAPTVADFSELIKQHISEGNSREFSPIEKITREDELPLSHAQQRMWFYEQLAGGNASFHIPLGVRLKGRVNRIALEQTFSEIIRRHESLRTVFPAVYDRPVQIIRNSTRFRLPLVNLSKLPGEKPEQVAAQLAQQEALRTFDLAHGPLLRPTLMRLAEEDHIIICTMHHIIADGQSFEVVIAEMSQLYTAMIDGQPSPLPELTVQYIDYAGWQRQWLQGAELETRLNYWRKQLSDGPARMNLPQKQTRRKVQGFKGARQVLNLSAELVAGLKDLTRRESMTLLMTLLSGFVLLLNRYTGDEDIVVGSAYANRERPEAEKLIGILANTLVYRVSIAGVKSFRELMKRVREMCLDAYSHQLTTEVLQEDFALRGEKRERLDRKS